MEELLGSSGAGVERMEWIVEVYSVVRVWCRDSGGGSWRSGLSEKKVVVLLKGSKEYRFNLGCLEAPCGEPLVEGADALLRVKGVTAEEANVKYHTMDDSQENTGWMRRVRREIEV